MAGTAILNTATGGYVDAGSGASVRLASNTVTSQVQPLEALLLAANQTVDAEAPPTASPSGGPGAATQKVTNPPPPTFTLVHRLTNTGNVATTFVLTVTAAGGAFVPGGLAIVEDLNGNGVADPGEPTLGATGSVELPPGDSLQLLVVGTVPDTAMDGQSAEVLLTARGTLQGATASNRDTVNLASGPLVVVTKSASTATPVPGGAVNYTVVAANVGGAEAPPTTVTVDGVPTSLFVVRDALPANTSYANASSPSPGVRLLFHGPGAPTDTYTTALPATVDAVAWGLPAAPIGATLTGVLGVSVHANAAGTLANTAYAEFQLHGTETTVASNAVKLPLPAQGPTIAFYTNASYATPASTANIGAALYVQVNAAACNVDPAAVATFTVTLSSALTGDTETFTATETAANTGYFRILPAVPMANARGQPSVPGDGTLEVLPDDRVTATTAGCGGPRASAQLVVVPAGAVFNSRSDAPVSGAVVELVDVSGAGNGGHPGAAAAVFAADGTTAAPAEVVTGADGEYSFPYVRASTYRLVLRPPAGMTFPSRVAPAALPRGRMVSATASYGAPFAVTAAGGPPNVDIPLDAGVAGGLFVQKTAAQAEVEVGDFVDYAVAVTNGTGAPLTSTAVEDALPPGFAFVAGSARLDGAPLPNPAGGAGPTLTFGIGTLAPAAHATLSYRVRVGPSAAGGTGTNTAQASSGATRSNVANATVRVGGGTLSGAAYLFGKVYGDCDRDRVQSAGEPGIPGVRIYLDDGTYAVTDGEGKYSLYGLTPRLHVAKLDATTLPAQATLEVLDNRSAGDPGSQFADLQKGEWHKADFAIAGCDGGLRDEIAARRAALAHGRTEIAVAAEAAVGPITAATASGTDPRSRAASGIVGRTVAPDGARAADPAAAAAPSAAAPPAAAAGGDEDPVAIEEALRGLSAEPGFLSPAEGAVIASTQARVRVKGAFGAELRLTVNGRPVDLDHVGLRSSLESTGVSVWEYVGVGLAAGDNTLELSIVDPFGNVRARVERHVLAAGALARIELAVPEQAAADAPAAVEVAVELLDEHGVRVAARTPVTLESSLGEWQTPDLDPKAPGTQVFVEGGVGRFRLTPPSLPGKATVRVTSGALVREAIITFLPNLRPMLAAGLAEGMLSLHSLAPGTLVPTQSGDAFERELAGAGLAFDDGKGEVAGRVSLFLKGKILGSDLLTLAYDSDKPADTPLFRDIRPDQFYPVYGDSSVKGYDAQSTGKLYVRVDRGTSYVLYGDFSTQSDNPARGLTQYSRALNGAKTHIEDGAFIADGFVSYTNSTQVVDELPANGTSGPYQLSQRNPVANSERVDIITRDRNQPSLVIADTPLTQFADYAVEPFSGQLLFKAPIPSVDANLNPNYLRIVYEVSNGGPSYWVGGADAREKISATLAAGGTVVRDQNPVTRETLGGANVSWTPDKATQLVGEIAASQSDLNGTGTARRVELKHAGRRVEARVSAVTTGAAFENPSSTYVAGTSEFKAKVATLLDERDRLVFDALRTTTSGGTLASPLSIPIVGVPESIAGGGSREGESLALEHTLAPNVKLTAGLRHFDASGVATEALALGAVPNAYTSARLRLDVPVPALPRASAFTQYEQAIDEPGRRDLTLGSTYQLAPQTKLYGTYQTSNSLSGDVGLNGVQQNQLASFGLDTNYMKDGKLFDEYRIGDGIDGRSAEAALGVRNLWTLAPGLGLSTSVQEIHPVSGVVTDTATALTAALQYTASPLWKGSTKFEWSRSDTAETWLSSVGAALKMSRDLTGLARVVDNEQLGFAPGAGTALLHQAQVGLAYRPVDEDVWNALAWIGHKRSANPSQGMGPATDEAADILSTHVNVQLDADWVVNARFGLKRATDYAGGTTTPYTARLYGARSVWDLDRRWDAGVQCFVEDGVRGTDRERALGGEVGYAVMRNVWLSVGFNVTGFRDQDLASEDYTQRGAYLRFRFKFDENTFRPSHNADPIPADPGALP
jgi:uncharacterized repeat protein (TIGR01451 family)